MNPPKIAAILLAVLVAIPLTFLGRYFHSESKPYVIPKTEPAIKDEEQAKKSDKLSLDNAFASMQSEFDSTHVIKTFPIKRDKDRVPEQVQEVSKTNKLVDREEEPPVRDVCQKDGGHKVKHGRYGWRCVYPHHRRRR